MLAASSPETADKTVAEYLAEGISDSTTVATVSVKVYYTPDFEGVTDDEDGFIASLIAQANNVVKNSNIPVKFELFSTEEATGFVEYEDPIKTMNKFIAHKG